MAKTIIENKPVSMGNYFKHLNSYRGLVLSFVQRDLKGKYAQTKLGLLWMLLQPIVVLIIFTVLFDQLIQLDTANIPYPVFAFSGMIIWYLFTNIVQSAGSSLISSQDLMKKIYFPKLILPLAKTIVALIESFTSLFLLVIIMILYEVEFSSRLLLFILPIFLTVLVGFCIALWLNAFSVKRRDLQHFIPHIVNTGIWLTPVFYPSSIIPDQYLDWFYYLNPIATIIALFRSILFDLPFQWVYCSSFIIIFVLLILGIHQFKKVERKMTDFI
ncbi:MAG: ABC transporter permease [Flavobacteriales bacterium]|nr:ABC transporter permease [Flavobacteriales bacterium]